MLGWPLDASNRPSALCPYIAEFIGVAQTRGGLLAPVALCDEYGSTVEARQLLKAQSKGSPFAGLSEHDPEQMLGSSQAKPSRAPPSQWDGRKTPRQPRLTPERQQKSDSVAAGVVLRRFVGELRLAERFLEEQRQTERDEGHDQGWAEGRQGLEQGRRVGLDDDSKLEQEGDLWPELGLSSQGDVSRGAASPGSASPLDVVGALGLDLGGNRVRSTSRTTRTGSGGSEAEAYSDSATMTGEEWRRGLIEAAMHTDGRVAINGRYRTSNGTSFSRDTSTSTSDLDPGW